MSASQSTTPNELRPELTADAFPVDSSSLGIFKESLPRVHGQPQRLLSLEAPWADVRNIDGVLSVVLLNLANHSSMMELRRFLFRGAWLLPVGGELRFLSRNPDVLFGDEPWPGDILRPFGEPELYRPLRHYLELLRLFPFAVRTPVPVVGGGEPTSPFLAWSVAVTENRDATPSPDDSARYSPESHYRRFNRLEEPEILDDLLYGTARLGVKKGENVLSIGVNDGRELEALREVGNEIGGRFRGIDSNADAIEEARSRFPDAHFLHADLAQLGDLDLPRCEVILALNVLHCTTVARDALLRDLKSLMAPECRVLFSIPNCHFGSHDILRRPLLRDHPRHDRSLVYKDARALTRWLYRAGFDVIETFGTYDVFLLGKRNG